MKTIDKLGISVIILAILSPLGLLLPKWFKSEGAWGEWSKGALWNTPLADYTFQGWQEKGVMHSGFAYMISSLIGVAAVFLLAFLITKAFVKNKKK